MAGGIPLGRLPNGRAVRRGRVSSHAGQSTRSKSSAREENPFMLPHRSGRGRRPADLPRPVAADTTATVDRDLALVEAAIGLHARALREGSDPDAPLGIVVPRLIVLAGRPADRARVEPRDLELVLRPEARNGWRSECVFHAPTGGSVHVDLVTETPSTSAPNVAPLHRPARCGRPGAAAMSGLGGRHAARTEALHRLGQIDREHSDRQTFEPDRVFGLGMTGPNGTQAPFASLWSLLNTAEMAIPRHSRHPPAPCPRRLHVFAAIETGTACAIATELFRGGAQSPATQTIRSSLRRVPDGRTLAVCETVLR
jgi:hypothetical protein